MSFPYEARKAGLTPVLIVFDPTPTDIHSQYQKKGLQLVMSVGTVIRFLEMRLLSESDLRCAKGGKNRY